MFRSLFICFSLTILQGCSGAFAEVTPFPIEKWVKTLSLENDFDNAQYTKIRKDLDREDSARAFTALRELEKFVSTNHYFNARLYCLKADQSYRFGPAGQKSMMTPLCQAALAEAYATGDNYLICSVSWLYGEYMYVLQQPAETAVAYLLKASEINDHLQKKFANSIMLWLRLGDLLYHIHEYERSIYFIQRALGEGNDTTTASAYSRMTNFNTIGQGHKQLGKLDSAMINYEKSMQLANRLDDSIWKGINVVFIAEVFYLQKDYSKARQLIENAYTVNYSVEPYVSAYGLQLLARINVAQGDNGKALDQVNKAQQLLNSANYALYQKMDYLQYTYYAAADVYRALGNTDSFYRYFQLYSNLHDSLQRVATLSSIKVAQLSIDNENNYRTVQQLNKEKKAEATKRNFIIAFLIMLSAIIILILNRQRQKLKYKEQLALEQKATAEANMAAAEAEKVAAQAQLEIFTQNFIEKTVLVERLEQQVSANDYDAGRQQLLEEIKHQTILTEEDWIKFKLLFEKIHPGFFKKLRDEASDVTLAEQRMAALTRLHLTTGQMAALLGISPNSVNKTKQRLRQRFSLPVNADIEDFIARF